MSDDESVPRKKKTQPGGYLSGADSDMDDSAVSSDSEMDVDEEDNDNESQGMDKKAMDTESETSELAPLHDDDNDDEEEENGDDEEGGEGDGDSDTEQPALPGRRKRQLVSLQELEYDPTFMETGSRASSSDNEGSRREEDGDDNSDEEEDDEEDDENYLQKFDRDLARNYIHEYHPEVLQESSDEVCRLAAVQRNAEGVIVDPLHKTVPHLTKYEKTKILGQRAKQIERGATPLVHVPENIIDSYLIAELELKEKKIPIILRRPLPNGAFEYWRLQDLEILV